MENCKNCGAPLEYGVCKYCGTDYNPQPQMIRFYAEPSGTVTLKLKHTYYEGRSTGFGKADTSDSAKRNIAVQFAECLLPYIDFERVRGNSHQKLEIIGTLKVVLPPLWKEEED